MARTSSGKPRVAGRLPADLSSTASTASRSASLSSRITRRETLPPESDERRSRVTEGDRARPASCRRRARHRAGRAPSRHQLESGSAPPVLRGRHAQRAGGLLYTRLDDPKPRVDVASAILRWSRRPGLKRASLSAARTPAATHPARARTRAAGTRRCSRRFWRARRGMARVPARRVPGAPARRPPSAPRDPARPRLDRIGGRDGTRPQPPRRRQRSTRPDHDAGAGSGRTGGSRCRRAHGIPNALSAWLSREATAVQRGSSVTGGVEDV